MASASLVLSSTAAGIASADPTAVAASSAGAVVEDWSAKLAYDGGDQVTFADGLWEALWWTRGQEPGDPNGPWQELVTSPEGLAVWTPSRVFDGGDVAEHLGVRYVARWHTRNQLPTDPESAWRKQAGQGGSSATPTDWSSTGSYDTGHLVRHDGHLWKALWWPGHQEPGALDGPWGEVAVTSEGATVWTPTSVFNTGDVVVFSGGEYVAKWWTRNQVPTDPNGPWRSTGDPGGVVSTWAPETLFSAGDVVLHRESRYVATQNNRDAEPGDRTGPWAAMTDGVSLTARPRIAGRVRAGRTVRARPGSWDGATVRFGYRWFAGRTPLAHATQRRYTIPARLRGKKLRVVVTARRHGEPVGSAASRAVRVRR